MAKPRKTPRPRAATPRGFQDYFGPDIRRRDEMLRAIADVYHLHGFDPLETSAVETVESLGKFLPDVDRPNDGVFAFEDDGTWLALRYDLTAPLARVAAQFRDTLPTPYRRYAMGPVWRNEKPGPGRFRQFYQCDADTVGSASPAADAEICAMLAAALEAAGIPPGGYSIRINDRRVLDGVMDAAGIPQEAENTRGIVLRTIDKLDRLGPEAVRALLGTGRRDESGDVTPGAGLTTGQIDLILAFTAARGPDAAATAIRLRELVGTSDTGAAGVEALEAIGELLDARGAAATLDPAVVRGLGYYTGPVFEAELTHEIAGPDGAPQRFGSIAGGGRYDDLVKRFTGQAVPATGISIGVDRLLAALAAMEAAPRAPGPVVVTVMDRARLAEYAAMADELRVAGIRAEVYLGNPKTFGNQLKYADRRGSPAAVIQGEDEAARGVVQVKDLALGAEIARTATLEEWQDRPAQREVPRGELVAAIREIVAR